MSTVTRTLRNLRKIGFKEYWYQLNTIGDTKAGTLIGTDRYGNKFFEDLQEAPCQYFLPQLGCVCCFESDEELLTP